MPLSDSIGLENHTGLNHKFCNLFPKPGKRIWL